MNFTNLFKTTPFVSWDFLMVIAVFVVFFLLGLIWHKKRILVIVLSLYLARLFLTLFSLPRLIREINIGIINGRIITFWGFFIFLFLIFAGTGVSLKVVSVSRLKKKKKIKYKSLKGSVYGFFTAGLFLVFTLNLMSTALTGDLSLLVNYLFISQTAMIVWTLLPIITMLIIK